MGFMDKLKSKFAKKEESTAIRYLDGYSKTRKSFGEKLSSMFRFFDGITDEFLELLMITLLEADVGVQTAEKIVDRVRKQGNNYTIRTKDDVIECLIEQMDDLYHEASIAEMKFNESGPTVILVVGINGVGKTTSIAKLAKYYQDEGKSVCVVAADTFRAGAVNQLGEWANRLGIHCVSGKENADPSSVLVEGCKYAIENNIDIVLADTAGRLQTKANLMKELEKMHRVCGKQIPNAPHNTWLVIDATTGQNGLSQAEGFLESAYVSGIILTKLDGTAKGGIVLAIKDKLNLPVVFVGMGETVNDIYSFDIHSFLLSIAEEIGHAE